MVTKNVKPKQYIPSFLKSYSNDTKAIRLNLKNSSDTNFESTSSFAYDVPNIGLKSTQQVNVDWSKFENHTFFNSAEVNVNIAFDKIINNFPFDGTKKELEDFFESLSGFENWVYDRFPKNVGYVNFFDGWHIEIKDYAGGLFPEISKNNSGIPILDPVDKSMSIEFHLFVPLGLIGNKQVVFQRINSNKQGMTCYIDDSGSEKYKLTFIVEDETSDISLEFEASKGIFNHICIIHNRDISPNILEAYVNVENYYTSQKRKNLKIIDYQNSVFSIGSGSNTQEIIGLSHLVGSIDEFRIFHSIRTKDQIKSYAKRNIYANENLKLYYKFNEPNGYLVESTDSDVNRIVLDSSGNSLHSIIKKQNTNHTLEILRELRYGSLSTIQPPIVNEKKQLSPILFTSYDSVKKQNEDLLEDATSYDKENPNIITRLIPQHYLIEGQYNDGLSTQEGNIVTAYSNESGIPGKGTLGSTQIMLSFLYTWAKFFDDIKIYIDAFSKIHFVDYDKNETTPDTFLRLLFKELGFKEPPVFFNSDIEQYVSAENIFQDYGKSDLSLRSVENEIFRRVLTSMGTIIKSKGTQRSIKSFLRSVGIDPDNSFRIREFGGPNDKQLKNAREHKIQYSTMLKMKPGQFFDTNVLYVSRSEPGSPTPSSNIENNGLLTSGSWTYEAIYKYSPNESITSSNYQSLVRLETIGDNISLGGTLFNLIASKSVDSPEDSYIKLYGRPGAGSTIDDSPILQLSLPVNIFDGEKWYISFGRFRKDQIQTLSSSYFLRASKDANTIYEAQNYFEEALNQDKNSLQEKIQNISPSGSFLVVGSQAQVLPNLIDVIKYYISSYDENSSTFEKDAYGDYFYLEFTTDGDFIHVPPRIKFFYDSNDKNNVECIVEPIIKDSSNSSKIVWYTAIKISDLTRKAGDAIWGGGTPITFRTINIDPHDSDDYVVSNELQITLISSLVFPYSGYTVSLEPDEIIEFFGIVKSELLDTDSFSYDNVTQKIKIKFKKIDSLGDRLLTTAPMKIDLRTGVTTITHNLFENTTPQNVNYVEWTSKNALNIPIGTYTVDVYSEYGEKLTLSNVAISYQMIPLGTLQQKNKKKKKSDLYLQNAQDVPLGQPTDSFDTSLYFLSNRSILPSATYPGIRTKYFEGRISNIRFWSKALQKEEYLEHIKNPNSLGVLDPTKNFNFVNEINGSFEKLRLDISMKSNTKDVPDIDGNITLMDYSQNGFHGRGQGFDTGVTPFVVDMFKIDYISPNFDEASTNNKVRVRSYMNFEKVMSSSYAQVAPLYQINPGEKPTDDTRFSIEYSLVDALNRDIVNIFATLDCIDNAIGNPELLFSQDYPKLENIRDVYFNRLTDKLNFKSFFEFFRWFENSIINFIDQLIPRKTKYLGTNFVIESHMLERPKFEYLYNEIYLGEYSRSRLKDSILLQQVVGSIKKF